MPNAPPTPRKLTAIERIVATDAAALAIMEKEATEREKKTERLRALRLAQEDVLLADAKARMCNASNL